MAEKRVLIPVYFTPERKAEIVRLAETGRRSVSSFVADVIVEEWFGGEKKVEEVAPKEEELPTVEQMHELAVRLNRLAGKANKDGKREMERQIARWEEMQENSF